MAFAVSVDTVTVSVSANFPRLYGLFSSVVVVGAATGGVEVVTLLFVTDADSLSPPQVSRTIFALVYAFICFLISSSFDFFHSSVILTRAGVTL